MPLKSLITAPHGGHGRTLRPWRPARRGIAIVINGSAPLGQLEPLPAEARLEPAQEPPLAMRVMPSSHVRARYSVRTREQVSCKTCTLHARNLTLGRRRRLSWLIAINDRRLGVEVPGCCISASCHPRTPSFLLSLSFLLDSQPLPVIVPVIPADPRCCRRS